MKHFGHIVIQCLVSVIPSIWSRALSALCGSRSNLLKDFLKMPSHQTQTCMREISLRKTEADGFSGDIGARQ